MSGFILAAAVLAAVALLLVLRPLIFRGRGPVTRATRDSVNAAVYREQIARLEQDRAEGTLGEEDYREARDELQGRALDELGSPSPQPSPASGRGGKSLPLPQAGEGGGEGSGTRSRATLVSIAATVPFLAIALYALLGRPGAIDVPTAAERNTAVESMVTGLAKRLEAEPGNLQGWAMLGRSYRVMGRVEESARAYERAGPFLDDKAEELAYYAEVAAATAGGSFAGKPQALVDKALKLEPEQPLALWLAGAAAYQRQDFAAAVKVWEKLASLVEPQSEAAKQLAGVIAEAKSAAGAGATKR